MMSTTLASPRGAPERRLPVSFHDASQPSVLLEQQLDRWPDVPFCLIFFQRMVVSHAVPQVDIHRWKAMLEQDVDQQESPDPSVAVPERMDGLELVVDHGC